MEINAKSGKTNKKNEEKHKINIPTSFFVSLSGKNKANNPNTL